MSERESMPYDVVIVGGGPAGLATAIRLKQLNTELSVCILEKGSEIGAHILSGAVVDPRALDELLPDWRDDGCPMAETPVTENHHWFLTKNRKFGMPEILMPPLMSNDGCYTGSLGNLCRWLAGKAEELGVEIFPGFPASEVLYDGLGSVRGVATGDMGVGRDGEHKPDYQPGMELLAKYTVFAEGARGHLTKRLKAKYDLERDCQPQVYGIGIKELWEVGPEKHVKGLVMHTGGWPMQPDTYGGGFIYHLEGNLVAIGYVVGLAYSNPFLSPFEEFQRYKLHPMVKPFLEGGKRIAYGARALAAGGLQALPKLIFPGGALIGDDAGFLNAARIKGSHSAIKSGILAAESIHEALGAGRRGDELTAYPQKFRESWLFEELHRTRNFKPWMSKGLWLGSLMFGIDQQLFRGKAPWTLRLSADHLKLKKAADCPPIAYPKPDGVITFDRLSSVFLSNTNHEENQPCHLRLKDETIPIRVNLALYDAPEQRYCPAGVYEIVRDADGANPRLQINAQNCVHCKTCDIKDPTQNIVWVTPEGGGGPNYAGM